MDAEYVHAVLDPQADAAWAERVLARMRLHMPEGPVQLTVRRPDDPLNPWRPQLFMIMRRGD